LEEKKIKERKEIEEKRKEKERKKGLAEHDPHNSGQPCLENLSFNTFSLSARKFKIPIPQIENSLPSLPFLSHSLSFSVTS